MQNRSFAHLCERASLHDARFCARGCATILAIAHVAGGCVYITFISIKILFASAFPYGDLIRGYIELNPETRKRNRELTSGRLICCFETILGYVYREGKEEEDYHGK